MTLPTAEFRNLLNDEIGSIGDAYAHGLGNQFILEFCLVAGHQTTSSCSYSAGLSRLLHPIRPKGAALRLSRLSPARAWCEIAMVAVVSPAAWPLQGWNSLSAAIID